MNILVLRIGLSCLLFIFPLSVGSLQHLCLCLCKMYDIPTYLPRGLRSITFYTVHRRVNPESRLKSNVQFRYGNYYI